MGHHAQKTGAHQVTDFESSINAVRAVSGFLTGGGHPAMGTGPSSETLAKLATLPPRRVREKAFELAGRSEALPQRHIPEIDVDAIDAWVIGEYDDAISAETTYPAVVVGAVSGAAFFLSAALGVPYLPQTTLVSVRDGETHPDEITSAMEAWAPAAEQIARNNPRVSVYHMHDPAQDRPMMAQSAFFRLKRRELGEIYADFLRRRLAPGGVIITLENTRTWRVTDTSQSAETAQRSWFQFGCLGGLPEEEYTTGSERVAAFLEDQGSEHRSWQAPDPTGRVPDGEWGWDPALGAEIDAFATEHGYARRRLHQNEPQDASAFLAELYRDWYRRLGWQDNRLLAQTYTHLDPWWTLATGSVPFWNRFHMEPSFRVLQEYLENSAPYREILISLFSHGLVSPGLVEPQRWRQLARAHAQERGEVIGIDEQAYPADTGGAFRYQEAMKTAGEHRELPEPLSVQDVDAFAERYGVAAGSADSLPEHTDDVEGHGLRNPIRWAR
ncbi:hypothetical protein [Nesterenkonia alba]|uniref:hypothetical protein n=1 Tax=Nesterenkonia alba TaxID=515814 RepID=UPI0003B64FBB|nr:hypothetical protein [Nesterenkonia alba]